MGADYTGRFTPDPVRIKGAMNPHCPNLNCRTDMPHVHVVIEDPPNIGAFTSAALPTVGTIFGHAHMINYPQGAPMVMNAELTPRQIAFRSAWWYACGANDTRPEGTPYVNPDEFAGDYADATPNPSSVQEAFRRSRLASTESNPHTQGASHGS